jgi:hypothetical protein
VFSSAVRVFPAWQVPIFPFLTSISAPTDIVTSRRVAILRAVFVIVSAAVFLFTFFITKFVIFRYVRVILAVSFTILVAAVPVPSFTVIIALVPV